MTLSRRKADHHLNHKGSPMRSTSRKIIVLLSALALTVTAAACSSSSSSSSAGGSANSGSSASDGVTYSPAQVAAATGTYKVVPIFAVPKTLPEHYTFAFLNPDLNYPYFAIWSQGMQAAAKFYGVTLDQADLGLKYDTELAAFQQVVIKNPSVIGSNPMNEATYNAATKDGVKIVLIDGTYKNVPHFGVSDQQVGKLSVDSIATQVEAKMSGAWNGRKVDVVGMSEPSCSPCDARVQAALGEAEAKWNTPAADTFRLVPQGNDPRTSAQAAFTDFLTAHPHDAIVIVYGDDESVVGAVDATKANHRNADVVALSNGGDTTARQALRDPSNAGILLGSVDYQPYAEGWNWIEAAIATEMGKSFGTYNVDRVLTPQNVNQYYPNDTK